MALKIFNSLSKNIEKFKPIKRKKVGIYTCGPTVYDYPHIGNYRAYIFADILKRYLQLSGFKINHIMNITDVDDKTIKKSIENSKTLKEFTEFYTEEFFKDIKILNILPADKYTKATEYIKEMLLLTEDLMDKGYAYNTPDGSVYFKISNHKEYGKLSNLKIENLKENADGRLKNDEYEKENVFDFAIWKGYDSLDKDIFWNPSEILEKESKIGKGRPGWHIECSAMGMKELGESFDIHTGGVDLIFPHHENEISQSECSTGKKFVKYWLHNEHLMVDGKKMSKSLGNFYTLKDIENMKINPLSFRYWLLTGHYRTKVNFTKESILSAETSLSKIITFYKEIEKENTGNIKRKYKKKFEKAMDDDLNTPKAIAILWELIKDDLIKSKDKKATLLYFDKVFGLGLENIKEDIIPEEIKNLSKKRDLARQNKDWQRSDEIRKEIRTLGYEIKDAENGPKITKL
jgi:cysteinyl-tRNA synthetase